MNGWRARHLPFLLLAIVAAGALKWHYHHATSADLAWILAPTAAAVNAWTGEGFSFDPDLGYGNHDGSVVIAPACAGVNFLIISFCMLVFTQRHRMRRSLAGLALLLGAAIIAYGTTLLVNTVRIVLSIRSAHSDAAYIWFSYDEIHRMEGIAVYFLALSLLYIATQAVGGPKDQDNGVAWAKLTLAVPLFWYLLVTLGIPILRLSFRDDLWGFLVHSLYVVGIPMAAVAGFALAKRMHSWVSGLTLRMRITATAVLLLLPGLAYGLWDVRPTGQTRFDQGRNGLWLGQQWYSGVEVGSGVPVSEAQADALLATLEQHGIRYAYPFAGPLTTAGTLVIEPSAFFLDLQRRAPAVLFLPWVAGKADELPLDDPAWRERVVQSMGRLYAMGIPGVHLDIEPLRDGHPGYTALLQAIREQFDGDFFVSHATRRVAPFGSAAGRLGDHFWSESFYVETMRAADQTVLMGYNTLLTSPKLYRAYMRHQTRLLLSWAAAIPDHQVLIGIPSYDDVPDYSDPAVENIPNGVLGVRAALEGRPAGCGRFEGVSIFAEWTTSEEEWETFRDAWL